MMKRYFHFLIGGGMLSLLAIQSQAIVTIGNSHGSMGDQHFTLAHYATNQPGQTSNAFDINDFSIQGNNDVFRVTQQAGQQPGTLTVVDLGHNTDNLTILDMGGNPLANQTNTPFANPNDSLTIMSPNAALSDNVNVFSKAVVTGITGQQDFRVQVEASLASQGRIALNFGAPVPEPSTGILSMIGLAGLFLRRRR